LTQKIAEALDQPRQGLFENPAASAAISINYSTVCVGEPMEGGTPFRQPFRM